MANAAADADEGGAPAITGINVTPLVDVTLVLLIVFMVTAKVIAAQAIPMTVPKATTPNVVDVTIAVGVAPNGALTLDGLPIADGPALARAAKARAGDGIADAHVVIAASPASSHGSVIGAIDALRSVGITKIAFAVEKTTRPSE